MHSVKALYIKFMFATTQIRCPCHYPRFISRTPSQILTNLILVIKRFSCNENCSKYTQNRVMKIMYITERSLHLTTYEWVP